MAEYINKAELQYDLANFTGWCEDERRAGVLFIEDCIIPNAPTIDIVRCSECKWCGGNKHYAICNRLGREIDTLNWFCADGERKE